MANEIDDFEKLKKDLKTIPINQKVQFGRTFLHLALSKNKPYNIIQLLLENGANPNIITPIGFNSLHIAIMYGCSKEVIQLLLDYDVYLYSKIDIFQLIKVRMRTDIMILLYNYLLINDLWYSESNTFKNYIQWLPCEMIQDTLAIFY